MKNNPYPRTREEPPEPDDGSLLESVTRFWVTTVILILIVYVTVVMISRTDGFRDLVRQELSERVGFTVKIGASRLSPGLSIQLEDIRGFLRTNEPPVVQIAAATLNVRWIPLLRGDLWPVEQLALQAPDFRFVATTNRGWQPLPWIHAALGPSLRLPGAESQALAAGVTEWMRAQSVDLAITDGRLRWDAAAADEPPVAVLEGVDLVTRSIRPENEPLQWFSLHVDRAETEEVEWMRDAQTTWIRMPDRDVVVATNGMRLDPQQWTWQHTLLHGAQ